MLTSPETVLGLSDGGAHCSSISDAQLAELDADPLGARPEAWARPAAGADRQAPDQRDRGLLRFRRPRAAGARAEGRCQRDRLRARCGCTCRRSATTCPPADAGWCSGSMAISPRWSPARRCSSTASTPAPRPESWCARRRCFGERVAPPPHPPPLRAERGMAAPVQTPLPPSGGGWGGGLTGWSTR